MLGLKGSRLERRPCTSIHRLQWYIGERVVFFPRISHFPWVYFICLRNHHDHNKTFASRNGSWSAQAVRSKKKRKERKIQRVRGEQWGLCDYIILRTILGGSPVISGDLARWQAKMASIEIWIPWRNAYKPHFASVLKHGAGDVKQVSPNTSFENLLKGHIIRNFGYNRCLDVR